MREGLFSAEHRWHIAALTVYTLLTVVLTSPLPANMSETVAGWSLDAYLNLWTDWWTEKALVEGRDLYHTDYIFYPQGTSLVFQSFSHVNTLISLLLTPLVGHSVAYNFTILLTYVLSGFSMYLLVSYLTDCRPAALVAGLVFAFHPYHIYGSDHPVLVTTQWIPLFGLALIRTLYDTGTGRGKQMLLAALWFLLTALSSWHLMIMLIGWTALYLLYHLFFERAKWVPGAFRYLILLAVLIGLALAPFLWPIIREQLTTDTTYMAVPIQSGVGNDLLSFFIPNRRHPLFGPLALDINDRLGPLISRRPAYLGYACVGLATGGVVATRRKTRFWLLTGLLFSFLSLGSQIRFNGVPLHTFHLPWAIPIISVLRHPFRLNVLLFFSLAVLSGFGSRWLYGLIARRGRALAYLVLVLVAGFILGENLVLPFPTIQLSHSPFLYQLAQEEGDFAVVDLPMGRQWAKYYLFCQTIHGKRVVAGVVSRTPYNAFAFADANPLLRPLYSGIAPDPGLNIEDQFAALADQDIRYIMVHKHFLSSDEIEVWRTWMSGFPPPFYEDEWVIVYRTTAATNYNLGQD